MNMHSDFSRIDHDFLDFSTPNTLLPPPPFFSDDFPTSLPSDQAAELEWLSQFIEDDTTSFHHSSPPLPIPFHTTSFLANNNITNNNNNTNDDLIPKSSFDVPIPSSSSPAGKSRAKRDSSLAGDGGVRRCTHCASEKTPQWRTGPLGPKTLCNACGVRFKSGRLVPEYRPAASPTFVLTQHSNSHRKVMELRRQKELLRQQQEQCYGHQHDFKVR